METESWRVEKTVTVAYPSFARTLAVTPPLAVSPLELGVHPVLAVIQLLANHTQLEEFAVEHQTVVIFLSIVLETLNGALMTFTKAMALIVATIARDTVTKVNVVLMTNAARKCGDLEQQLQTQSASKT